MKKTTTKKASKKTAYKLDPKRRAKMDDIIELLEEQDEDAGEEGGIIRSILKLYAKGFMKKEIVAYGYNKSTVYRQTGELDKYKKRPALQYYGHDLFEARVQRLMAAKKLSRDKAVNAIMDLDIV